MEKKVVIERTYEAPIGKVWAAITNKEQMKQWYFEVDNFKAERGFEFQFSGEGHGKKYVHKCRVVEANPVTKLAYTWSYEGYEGQSLVTFELFSEGKNKTRLRLTHSDLHTFPQDTTEFASENFNEGWKSLIGDSLRNFVETGDITKSIRIRASAKQIWDIVLQPNDQWGLAFGGGAMAETDWTEGSPVIWKDLANNIGANGIVEVHQPEKYLQLHYYDDVHAQAGDPLGEYFEKYSVVPGKDECTLSIEAGRIAKKHIPSHEEAWDKALQMIKERAERG